ncbi:MAG TPA: ATP-binding protein [Leptospiraceae bacterium]|nr:ATP-binding protein [Leptospiraceae bacterium]HNN58820.1 ATP-binding protein [Leptospiraceae bacterium]
MRSWLALAFFCLSHAVYAECDREWVPGNSLDLSGSWKYAQAGEASSPELDDSGWKRTSVPGLWGKNPALANYRGELWMRCHVTLNGEKPENVALNLGLVEDMDEAYFNGNLVGRTGSFARNTVDIETERLYALPAALWREGDNVIAVRIRGSSTESGIHDQVRIENEQMAARRNFLKNVPAIVCSVLYILTSGFFLLFYVFFRHRYEHMFFALFSAFLGFYHLIRTNLRLDIFTSFEFSYQVELALLFCLPGLFINYLIYLLKLKRPPIVWALMGFSLILVIGALLSGAGKWPIKQAWQILILANLAGLAASMIVILWIVGKNYKERREELRYIVYGFLVLTPAVLHDMLVTLKVYEAPRATVYAFLLFLGFISLQLSDSILDLYRNMKHQENDLKLLEKKKTTSILNVSSEFKAISEQFEAGVKELRAGKDPESSQLTGASLHLEKFVHDSRLLHMLEEGEYSIRRIRFNLRKLCEDTVQEALSVTGQSKKRLQMEFPDAEILADPDLLSTALYHLIENGLLYTKGRVEAVGEMQGGMVHFAVRDEGPGLNPEMQKQVFLKFERAVDENSDIPGSGIGLAIVSLIAERLGGKVSLEGGGFFSTYRFQFPLSWEGGA